MEFSRHIRPALIERVKSIPIDLLIIGGGITGAGIALDASARGLKVVLVEKNDFASGTSSRSTKLIHGGLRYLKQLEFGLVKEVGSERAVVHRLAPHLVIPEKMLLPLYEKRGFGSVLTSFGLKLYDWLAGVRREDQRRMLTRRQTLRQEPILNDQDVKGGAIYAEYRTDDARLTMEIIKSAYRQGALPLSYCAVTGLNYTGEKLEGVLIMDKLTGQTFSLRATCIVNASGPWVDEIREMDHSKKGKRLHLTKGVHIVLSSAKLPVQQAIYFDVPDGRMIFAIPRGKITYVGTTDTNYAASKEVVTATLEDVDYLLAAVNRTFRIPPLKQEDVLSSWAGLRPLIHEEGKSASELSRKDEIFESPSGLISIAGGKLTGYRKMSERVLDLVTEKFFKNRTLESVNTEKIRLTDPAFNTDLDVHHYIGKLSQRLLKLGGEQPMASYLVHTYGKESGKMLDRLENGFQGNIDQAILLLELEYTLREEMVTCSLDFFVRRTGMLFFDIQRMKDNIEVALSVMKKDLGWDEDKMNDERKQIEDSINLASRFTSS